MSRVFIASSVEGRRYAEAIARVLHAENHEPLLWWSQDAFPLNETLIGSLSSLAERSEGALIVATPDDRTVHRRQSSLTPTSNVLLEYGLFVGRLGKDCVAIVKVGDPHLPSDLDGVVYIRIPDTLREDVDPVTYEAVHLRGKISPWLRRLDAASSNGARIAGLLDKLGPFTNQAARIDLKSRILSEQLRRDNFAKLPPSQVQRLLTRYSRSFSSQQSVGFRLKTPVNLYLDLATVPTDSDDERTLSQHLARIVADLIVKIQLAPTLIAISKPAATAIVRRAAGLLPYPVVLVNPDGPTRERTVEGTFEVGDRAILIHDVALSGHHLIDCVLALRSVGIEAENLVTLAWHEGDSATLVALMAENGMRMHADTRFAMKEPQLSSDCLLCDVLAEADSVPFRHLFSHSEMTSEILLQTNRFAVVADVAPLTVGHVLIVPKSHIAAIAAMSDEDKSEIDSLRLLVASVLTKHGFPATVAFEHGLCDPNRSSECGIDHAHLHVMPSPGDLAEQLRMECDVMQIASIRSLSAGSSEYLLLINESGDCFVGEPRRPASQFFRRVVSALTRTDLWNWHDRVLLDDQSETRAAIIRVHAMFSEA